MAAVKIFEIVCAWDEEAKVWYVAQSNVPGLSAEAPTHEAMNELLQHLVPELLQLNMPEKFEPRVPIELLVKSSQKVTVRCN